MQIYHAFNIYATFIVNIYFQIYLHISNQRVTFDFIFNQVRLWKKI